MQSVTVTPKTKGALKISLSVRATSAKLEDVPLTITENGLIQTPQGIRYNPIIVEVKAKDEPLTITENNTEIISPEGIRYTPITVSIPEIYQEKRIVPSKEEQVVVADDGYNALSQVTVLPIPEDYVNKNEVQKPTLNAPKIEFNANGGYMYILDGANGNFSEGYQLYLNGEESVVLTSTNIKMQDYGITETDEIGLVAVGNLFNNSPMATARWSDLELGTIGLTYSGNAWTGLGTATETEIYVAGLVNGVAITSVGRSVLQNDKTTRIIKLPNSLSTIQYGAFVQAENKTIIFGRGISNIEGQVFYLCDFSTLDFRLVDKVPTITSSTFQNVRGSNKIIVPDELYDAWIVATNWSAAAQYIVKASIYEAQQGGTV